MPPQTSKSRFTGTMKANAAKPVEWADDFGDLPGDIRANEGVAALSVAKIQDAKGGANKGKPQLYMAGIVQAPKEVLTRKMVWNPKTKTPEVVEGSSKMRKIENLRTQIYMPMCATGKGDRAVTEEENVESANNMMKRLFGQNFMADNGIESDDDLDAFLAAVSKADPPILFRFSTQWNPPHIDPADGKLYEDGVWPHKWHGTQGLEDYVPEVTDTKEADPEPAPLPPPPPAKPPTKTAAAAQPPQDGKDLDYTLMAKKAEAKDMDARKRLREAALAQGWTEEQIDDPSKVGIEDTWAGVAQMASQGPQPDEPVPDNGPDGDVPQDQPAYAPKAGDQVWVQVRDKAGKPAMDAKTRKPKPLASAEITKVYAKDEVADCLDADDKKTMYVKVAFIDLTQA